MVGIWKVSGTSNYADNLRKRSMLRVFVSILTLGVKVDFLAVLGFGTRNLWDAHAPIVVPITRSNKGFLKAHGR